MLMFSFHQRTQALSSKQLTLHSNPETKGTLPNNSPLRNVWYMKTWKITQNEFGILQLHELRI